MPLSLFEMHNAFHNIQEGPTFLKLVEKRPRLGLLKLFLELLVGYQL